MTFPQSLAVAAALLSAKDPLCLSDAGFLFSFGSLCGICMLTPLFECLFGCGTEKKNIWTHMGKADERKFGSESVFAWSYAVLLF